MILYPPNKVTTWNNSIFLAGTIDMGLSEDWQAQAGTKLSQAGFTVLNPRRKDWDSSWTQQAINPQFREQVEWELEGLEKSTYRLFYFAPHSKSPITLLELGLHINSPQTYICCPSTFWRKGNVDIVAQRAGKYVWEDLDEVVDSILCHNAAISG